MFPLRAAVGARYLIDSASQPFFLVGDTAWSLATNLLQSEIVEYLDNRRAKGFNAFSVNLVEHYFTKQTAPLNNYGQPPFTTPGDFTTPNDAYWQLIDFIFQQAAARNLLVLAFHSYNGYGGGVEGWYQEMVACGPTKMFTYGQFLGNRYRTFNNIMWMSGGDYDAPDKALTKAVINGINSVVPNALQSHHGQRNTDVLAYWAPDLGWFQANSLYDAIDTTTTLAANAYDSPNWKPFFRIENKYEGSDVGDRTIRMLAYGSVLQGGMGAVYGHVAVWPFGGPYVVASPLTWRQAMDSQCGFSITHFKNLFAPRAWTKLVPDFETRTFMTTGWGSNPDYNFAALANDRSFGIVYLSNPQGGVTVDLGRIAGPNALCRWYDPVNGTFQVIGTFPASGPQSFNPAMANAGGQLDWALLIETST